jgi:hypothetical protein
MVNVKLTAELTIKEPLIIPGRSGATFQSIASYVDPRTVVDEEQSPLLSPLPCTHSSATGSPCSSAPFLEHDLATNPTFCPQQSLRVNCYPVLPPHEGISVDSPITSFSTESTDIKQEPPPTNQSIPPPKTSTSIRRRGPGRPTKAQAAANYSNTKRPTGHSAVKVRRQMHNDSAMRSRARLNKALEDLWAVIPLPDRTIQSNGGEDNREVCRAVKVEVAIAYVRKLQASISQI